jgi:hypothetical protein
MVPYQDHISCAAPGFVIIIPTGISKSIASKGQPISNIAFTSDGNSLIVSTEDGRVIQELDVGRVVTEPWRVYNL